MCFCGSKTDQPPRPGFIDLASPGIAHSPLSRLSDLQALDRDPPELVAVEVVGASVDFCGVLFPRETAGQLKEPPVLCPLP